MQCKKQDNNVEHARPVTYIKPTESDTFALNFDQDKVSKILSLFDSYNDDSSKETINHITCQNSDAFKAAASNAKCSRTISHKPKGGINRPWFGFKCQTARRKYHLAKCRHNIHKSDSSRNALVLASRSYKRTMNIFISKHKFNKQRKLRKMQKGQPKEYWKFLNSLKIRKLQKLRPYQVF